MLTPAVNVGASQPCSENLPKRSQKNLTPTGRNTPLDRPTQQCQSAQRFGAALHRHIRGRISDALAYAVENYRAEVGDIISSTVAKWDGASTADKLELQVGRDLQFIRINGTIVGGLAGLAIHAVGQFL